MQQLGIANLSAAQCGNDDGLGLTVTILCMIAGGELSSTACFQMSSGLSPSSGEEDSGTGVRDDEIASCSSERKASLKFDGNAWPAAGAWGIDVCLIKACGCKDGGGVKPNEA